MKKKQVMAISLAVATAFTAVPGVSFAGNLDPASDAKSVSLQVAAEGAVLLENNGILPFNKDETKVAVFGRTQIDIYKGGGGGSHFTHL